MTNRASTLLPLSVLILTACAQQAEISSTSSHADYIFKGGPIYTLDTDQPVAEAVATKGNRIVAVGAAMNVDETAGPNTRVIDLQGAAMYPGFVDAHAHFIGIGARELTLNLEGVGSIEEMVDIIAANVAETPEGAVIYGRGWIETGWPEGRFPTRADLDAVSPDNPVILERADGHAVVANSKALKDANVTAETQDPDGGRIERDASGEPTGMLIDNAASVVMALRATPTVAERRDAYKAANRVYAAYGWTGVHNMSVHPANVPLMEEMSETGDIGIRLYNAIDVAGLDALVENGPRVSDQGRVVTRAIKMYVDGALGSRGAALSAPYADAPDTNGLLLVVEEHAKTKFRKALNNNIQVATHAIGDRGNKLVLDWYRDVLQESNKKDTRWRIEHSQILHTEDISRFAGQRVIASMQPSHAISDLYFAPARLGPDRLDGAYAWRALIDAGAVIAGGSDAPVERGDPLIEFYAAVERRGLDGYQDENWRADQAVTREEALKMFTLWPAYAAFQENDLGSIEAGKKADFTVFSKDIMTVTPSEILDADAIMTVVDGNVIFDAKTNAAE